MTEKSEILRNIPQVEILLQEERLKQYIPLIGRSIVIGILRGETEKFRSAVMNGGSAGPEALYSSIYRACETKRLEKLQHVINGTGVIIHTNLGRSPLSERMLTLLRDELSGYTNLEYHIPSKGRGKRGGYAEELMCHLTSAEDALIVNNNAAAVFLMLNEFCTGREVIVSRGELVQIGGGFRVPEIMARSGARLVEVGTTNITSIDDYRNAITDETAMVLSVHRSNFTLEGFTSEPTLKELSSLKTDTLLFGRDLGSGNLVFDPRLPKPFEPTISQELSQGADIISFSGDKLLGGCQGGFLVGAKEHISRLRRNQLMRMLRVDKITYFLIQETLLSYVNGSFEDLPVWSIILQDSNAIRGKAARFRRRISPEFRGFIAQVPVKSTFGGGAMPARELDSAGIVITVPGVSPEEIYDHFITSAPPAAGVILDNAFTFDFRTIFDRDIIPLAASAETLFRKHGGT
jgi:L-seryl-tRNA(Ser) seleniumtransferase